MQKGIITTPKIHQSLGLTLQTGWQYKQTARRRCTHEKSAEAWWAVCRCMFPQRHSESSTSYSNFLEQSEVGSRLGEQLEVCWDHASTWQDSALCCMLLKAHYRWNDAPSAGACQTPAAAFQRIEGICIVLLKLAETELCCVWNGLPRHASASLSLDFTLQNG